MADQVTPSIFTNAEAFFGGSFIPAHYRILYVNGAYQSLDDNKWYVTGYHCHYSGNSGDAAFLNTGPHNSQALAEAAEAGRYITIAHDGSSLIRMALIGSNFNNASGSPNPTFRLGKVIETFSLSSNAEFLGPQSIPMPSNAEFLGPQSIPMPSNAEFLGGAQSVNLPSNVEFAGNETAHLTLPSNVWFLEGDEGGGHGPPLKEPRLCPAVNCPGSDSPIINASSELPDKLVFLSVGFPPPGNVGGTRTGGNTYWAEGCLVVCESEVSQEDADLCAALQAIICAYGCQPGDPACDFTCPGDPRCVNCPPDNPDCTVYECPGDPRCGICADPSDPNCQYHCPEDPRCVNCPPENPACGDCPPGDPTCATYQCPGDPRCVGRIYFSRAGSCEAFCEDGLPFTFTVPAGKFAADSQELADRKAAAYACNAAAIHRVCLSALPAGACKDQAFDQQVVASGSYLAQLPNSDFWEVSHGTLPPGLAFNGGYITGGRASITGTPTTAGTYTFTIRCTVPNGDYMEKIYQVKVLSGITNSDELPEAIFGVDYSVQLLAPDFINPEFHVVGGSLPAGLMMDGSGLISGKITEQYRGSQFVVKVQFGGEELNPISCQKTFTINAGETITPDIFSNTPSYFGGGALAAGKYRVGYVRGALKYEPNFGWSLNANDALPEDEYRVVHGGVTVSFPGTPGISYGSQAAVESANKGAHIDFTHSGGTIGVFLNDTNYPDNVAGSPNPTFRLTKLS